MGKNAYYYNVWAEIPLVLALSRAGTLENAANQLGVNRTTVSRRLKAFENVLGGRLFSHASGKYTLTNLGAELLSAAEASERHLLAVKGLVPDHDLATQGAMRITVAPNLMPKLAPMFAALKRDYPELQFQLTANKEIENVGARESDIALRILRGRPEYPLVGRRLEVLRGAIYKKKKLAKSKLIHIVRTGEVDIPRSVKFLPANARTIEVDDVNAKLELIAAAGAGRLPVFMGDSDNRIERISELLPDAGWRLWLVYHSAFKDFPRIRIVVREFSRYFS